MYWRSNARAKYGVGLQKRGFAEIIRRCGVWLSLERRCPLLARSLIFGVREYILMGVSEKSLDFRRPLP
jgi:hypothetical protein